YRNRLLALGRRCRAAHATKPQAPLPVLHIEQHAGEEAGEVAALGGAESLGEPDAAGAHDFHGPRGAFGAVDAEADGLGGGEAGVGGRDAEQGMAPGIVKKYLDSLDATSAILKERLRST